MNQPPPPPGPPWGGGPGMPPPFGPPPGQPRGPSMPGQPMQGQPMHGQPMQGQPMPGQGHPMPGGYRLQPMPAPSSVPLLSTSLGAASIVLIVLGMSIDEHSVNNWHNYKAWGGVAIAAAALTLAGLVAPKLGWTSRLGWQLSALGAGLLVFFWVLFVVPDIQKNTSLLLSLGVAAGVGAVWLAPGREQAGPPGPGAPPRGPPAW
ncbi:MAG: hypothetical protein ACR2KJ_03130 [Jatrophihabitans sp.]